MVSISDLQAQKRALDASLAEVRSSAKRLKSKASRQQKSRDNQWRLDGKFLKITLAIFVLTSSCDAAVAYLIKLGRKRRWVAKDTPDLEPIVLNAVLAADLHILAAFADPDAVEEAVVLRAAVNFATQWRLVEWCKEQNHKGIAPNTSLMLDRWEQLRAVVPAHVRPNMWGVSASAAARVRVWRLRRCFNGRIGKFRVGERLPVGVMLQKVDYTSPCVCQFARSPAHPLRRPLAVARARAAQMRSRRYPLHCLRANATRSRRCDQRARVLPRLLCRLCGLRDELIVAYSLLLLPRIVATMRAVLYFADRRLEACRWTLARSAAMSSAGGAKLLRALPGIARLRLCVSAVIFSRGRGPVGAPLAANVRRENAAPRAEKRARF